jgi:hypothetical protein
MKIVLGILVVAVAAVLGKAWWQKRQEDSFDAVDEEDEEAWGWLEAADDGSAAATKSLEKPPVGS